MSLIGVSLEPPLDPRSWSGSSHHLFGQLMQLGVVRDALHVRPAPWRERLLQIESFAWPRERWRARYNASPARFRMLTACAREAVRGAGSAGGVLQIGARMSVAGKGMAPVFGYHDGNAALRYRHFDQGLISSSRRDRHLAWEGQVYSGMRGIFLMSSWLASSFMKDFGIPASRLHVVGAGINFAQLPVPMARDFSRPHFLFVGKEFERKGGPVLLEAFAQAKRALPHARLTIVGPASIPAAGPGVECAGFLSKSDPAQAARLLALFGEATTMVLPSLYEPFGISLLEGMANGMACLAVDRCAMPEIVQHGRTGVIVAAGDPVALARGMVEIGSQPEMAAEMGRLGRLRVEADYTWPAVTRRMRDVLRDEYRLVE